jgi:TonB family protein
LRTTAGKIRLQYLDSEMALRESLIREQIERISQRIPEYKPVYNGGMIDSSLIPPPDDSKTDWLESWLLDLERRFRGGISEEPDDFLKRLTSSPTPSYPALAQRAGLQGLVKLQVRVRTDGSVEVLKLLQGEPALADAAIAAVKQWRSKPLWINGKAVEVISTVTFNFKLH